MCKTKAPHLDLNITAKAKAPMIILGINKLLMNMLIPDQSNVAHKMILNYQVSIDRIRTSSISQLKLKTSFWTEVVFFEKYLSPPIKELHPISPNPLRMLSIKGLLYIFDVDCVLLPTL